MNRISSQIGLFSFCMILFFIIMACSDDNNGSGESEKNLYYSTFFKDGVSGVDGLNMAFGTAVSPDGKNVYVTGQQDSALAVFNRNTSDGSLSYSTRFKDGVGGVGGLNGARGVTVSPDGKNVYVAGYYDDALVVFNRNTSNGSLTYSTYFEDGINGVDGLNGVMSITVSPDGKTVYAVGSEDDALAVFNRNTSDGSLTYSTVFKDGIGSVDGLDVPSGVAVSPDGKNVYVTGYNDDALAVFDRNITDGSLTYSTVLKNGIDSVDGLNGALNVIVSPDNKNVYTTGYYSSALAVFDRDTVDGSLTYSAVFKDGTGGIDKLDGAWSLTITSDGEYLYVTGRDDNALAVFKRDNITGSLSFSIDFEDGVDSVDGLDGPTGVAVSPDGENIYVTGYDDNALAVFEWR